MESWPTYPRSLGPYAKRENNIYPPRELLDPALESACLLSEMKILPTGLKTMIGKVGSSFRVDRRQESQWIRVFLLQKTFIFSMKYCVQLTCPWERFSCDNQSEANSSTNSADGNPCHQVCSLCRPDHPHG
jgi:hypothetical protein